MGKKKKTLVIESIYQITIYLFDTIYIFFFSLLQQQVFGPSDTVSLKNKNAKYTTAQQQQPTYLRISSKRF